MRSGSDPITEDPSELDARADEADREQRWVAFTSFVRGRRDDQRGWANVIMDVANAMYMSEHEKASHYCLWELSMFQETCLAFAESEGWDAVLSAIARAMREQAKAHS